jgi:hypothetical protein
MTGPGSDQQYVLLKGGLAVPAEPLRLLFDLEGRGFTLRREGDELVVVPGRTLTDADRVAIRRWKSHMLALLAYMPPELRN